jgi:hypothetical protein
MGSDSANTPWPDMAVDWDKIEDLLVGGGFAPARAQVLVAACRDLQPQPQPPENGWDRRRLGNSRWFANAIGEVERRCLGFDPSQSAGEGCQVDRLALRLLSPSLYVLRFRFPDDRAIRTAEMLVDLKAPDGKLIIPIDGNSTTFHNRVSVYFDSSVPTDPPAAVVADYARAFCRYLTHDGSNFAPCESIDELRGQYLGPVLPEIADNACVWQRLAPSEGVDIDGVRSHLFRGGMHHKRRLFTVMLQVMIDPARKSVGWAMIDENELSTTDLPVVPLGASDLTRAYFPLRSA